MVSSADYNFKVYNQCSYGFYFVAEDHQVCVFNFQSRKLLQLNINFNYICTHSLASIKYK